MAPETSRIAHLQKANAGIRFLSVEPLIGPVGKLDLAGIGLGDCWRRERPARTANGYAAGIDVRNQCLEAKVAAFFKQWGGLSPKSGGRLLEGKEWDQ